MYGLGGMRERLGAWSVAETRAMTRARQLNYARAAPASTPSAPAASRNAQNCVDRTNCDRTNCDRMNCDRTNRIVNRMRAAREASRAARILFTILFILSQFVLSQFVLSTQSLLLRSSASG